MGWDAFAVPFKGRFRFTAPNDPIEDATLSDPEFNEAVANARLDSYGIDGLLGNGGLDCNVCGQMLRIATGCSVHGDPWSPKKVKELAAKANWDFETYSEHEKMGKASAKAFLNQCAKLGRGIRFSW